jgi:hypothetical protein
MNGCFIIRNGDKMNKTLKWILISFGILLGLILLAMTALFLLRGYGFHPGFAGSRFGGGFLMPRTGMMVGMGLIMLFRFLVPAGVLALAVLGVIGLLRSRKTTPDSQVDAPRVTLKTCVKCNHPVQQDWEHCAYCGKKIINK